MFIKMIVANNIKSTIPQTESAKEYMQFVEERFRSADKSLAGTLMAELMTMKFDGSRTMQEHIIEMTNIATRLKSLRLTVEDFFLIQFILNSLPSEYGLFQINYNTIKDKWNVNELASRLVQEEGHLKNQVNHSVSFVSNKAGKEKKGKSSHFKKKRHLLRMSSIRKRRN
jgi:gag-polypeptide of LTR copia-type